MKATVIGTGMYQVRIDLNHFEHSCDCPAFRGDQFCKYQVAVLLTKLHGKNKAKRPPKIKKQRNVTDQRAASDSNLTKYIGSLSHLELKQQFIHLADEIPGVRKFLLSLSQPKDEQFLKDLEKGIKRDVAMISW